MPSLYDQIASNRRRSVLLVVGFSAFATVLGYVFGRALAGGHGSGLAGALVALLIGGVWLVVVWFGGSRMTLALSGAKEVTHDDEPQLVNVVEEIAIAGGLPVPRIFLIEDTAPNAFATGRDPKSACIAVTRGLLEKLKRDELQGVIAHEISHVQNRDILYATLTVILLGLVALMSDFFLRSLFYGRRGRGRSRRGRGGGSAQAIFLIIGLVLAIIAPIVAKLIQLAASREREYLADSSSALLTRYPEGLASALEKIASDRDVLEVANRATQHLYIVNPIKPFEARAKSMWSTHPPIAERARRLREMK